MTELIDICCNFGHGDFRKDEAEVLQRAQEAGVTRILTTGSNMTDSAQCIALAEKYPDQLWATVGVHPHHADDWVNDTFHSLRDLAKHPKVVAIGETGLDFNRNYSMQETQKRVFGLQLQLAKALKKPLFTHQRDAHEDFIHLLKQYRADLGPVVVHCFTGTEYELVDYLDLDCHIGITGWICDERRGHHLKDFIKRIPADRLMIETDAPYLLPRDLPNTGKNRRNEPMHLPHIAATIASAVNKPVEQLIEETTLTARAFYGLP